MVKQEFITKVSEVSEMTKKDVEKVLEALSTVIKNELANGEEIPVMDLGKFVAKDVAEREGRNPATGEPIVIPAHKSPKFKVSSTLKKLIK